jgi:hypothetical protein
MAKKKKGVISRLAIIVVVLTFLLASAPVFAQGAGATQGQVAMNLALLLGVCPPAGATQVDIIRDTIRCLTDLGIAPAGGWNADAQAESNFVASLYGSVHAAITAGRVVPPAGLGNASAIVAAASTQAGMSREMVVNAIDGAGGNRGDATQGAAMYGGTYRTAQSPQGSFGPTGGPGPGGGGGGVNPSPSK